MAAGFPEVGEAPGNGGCLVCGAPSVATEERLEGAGRNGPAWCPCGTLAEDGTHPHASASGCSAAIHEAPSTRAVPLTGPLVWYALTDSSRVQYQAAHTGCPQAMPGMRFADACGCPVASAFAWMVLQRHPAVAVPVVGALAALSPAVAVEVAAHGFQDPAGNGSIDGVVGAGKVALAATAVTTAAAIAVASAVASAAATAVATAVASVEVFVVMVSAGTSSPSPVVA